MNYGHIIDHLVSQGFDAKKGEYLGEECLQVDIRIESEVYSLKHQYIDEITRLPHFFLHDESCKTGLAHVLPVNPGSAAGICLTVEDAVSVNYDVPELAFEDSLMRCIEILKRVVTDPDWNRAELIREFAANWSLMCDPNALDFICVSISHEFENVSVMLPMTGKKSGLKGSYVALSESAALLADYSLVKEELLDCKRISAGTGMIVPLAELTPPPIAATQLQTWYIDAINKLDKSVLENMAMVGRIRSKVFWVIFNAETVSGRTWFGIRFESPAKKYLPLDTDTIKCWTMSPIRVRNFSPETMLPRGGAHTALREKSVLLVGCGSVGGEIADKLASAGIGKLHLSDPDTYSWDNIYRHMLPTSSVGFNKSFCIDFELENNYPWVRCQHDGKRLLDHRDVERLKSFDLIIVAIGSPTHERLFAEFYRRTAGLPAIMNTWLEGYGVGGHATLQVPGKKGCLFCAYVDNTSLSRGLASNLNFIVQNQDVTINHAGCGDLFLPYSGIDSSQTAVMASHLAVDYLLGNVSDSLSVSWRGGGHEAKAKGIELTHRFHHFSDSLSRQPLYHEGCDACR
ncbi:MAG: ThiF family adenylyltransferase [Pseudomonadota bacterium]